MAASTRARVQDIPIPLPTGGLFVDAKTGQTSPIFAAELHNFSTDGILLELRPESVVDLDGGTVLQRVPYAFGVSPRYIDLRSIQAECDGVTFARQALVNGQLRATGETITLPADMVLKAIGQKLDVAGLDQFGLTLKDGRIVADDDGRTGVPGLYAGGDCRLGGLDLTVEAVQDGKRAALAIHAQLSSSAQR